MGILENSEIKAVQFASDVSDTNSVVDSTQSMKETGIPSGSSWGRQQLNWMFKKIYNAIDKLSNRSLDREKNLSDVASKSGARLNLGLGSAATHNIGEQEGEVIRVGNSFGLGMPVGAGDYATNLDNHFKSGFYKARGDAVGGASANDGGVLVMAGQNDTKQLGWDTNDVLRMRGNDQPDDSTKWSAWRTLLHTGNIRNGSIIKLGLGLTGEKWVSKGNATNKTYTNSKNYPVQVNFFTTNGRLKATCGAATFEYIDGGKNSSERGSLTFIVPANTSYSLTSGGGTTTTLHVLE